MSGVQKIGDGRYRIELEGLSRVAYGVANGRETWVFVDGRVYVLDEGAPAERGRPPQADERAALASPMPATVTAVNVTPGTRVGRGDVMIMLEAMKMELPIKAPRDATVKAIHCQQGQLVDAGVPLVELE